ncbi:S9 family peptidase [Sulfobacillus sp. hq2]|uniref:alpha/beta hydrolase family protein n=1 Tax=Sulfobacillus TaxID=28033 RepID=UPI000CD092B5|nr:S9 family peptidase [Sulfobacillus sp. hq2]POB10677.1 S9 family peptidase [Sulfobacillus sp. hq2]
MPTNNPTIEQFLRIRQAFGARFTGSGHHVVFLMNLTGTAQVYVMNESGGWPHLVTDFDNRVMDVWPLPQRAQLLFAMDQGGNENSQLYLTNEDGTDILALTNNPAAMYNLGAISVDGQWLAITSNARNGQDYDIYLLKTGDTFDQSQLIKKNQGWWRVLDFSSDNRRLLAVSHLSNLNHELYELIIDTGEMMHLTPHQGNAQYNFAQYWGPQEDVLMASDENAEFTHLALWRRQTRRLEWLTQDPYDVEYLAVHRPSGHYAYVLNRQGYSQLYVSANGMTEPIQSLSKGVIAQIDWHPNGSDLALTYHDATHNPNVYRVHLNPLETTPITWASRSGLDFHQFVEPTLHAFPSFDGLMVPVWLYRPQQPHSERVPVVISVHGGPESQERPGFNPVYQYLLSRGFAIAAPNVRGSAGYGKTYVHLDDVQKRMDSVKDLAALVTWLRDQPGINGHRIALMGGSYGGFMVLAGLTTYPDLFAAGVDIVGIANLETFLENTSPYRRKLREAEYGSLDHDRAFFRTISPVYHVNNIQAPLMVVHGQNDPRVPVSEAEQIVKHLRAKNLPVEYMLFEDEGHGVVKLKNRLTLYPRIASFLEKHLMHNA